MDHAASGEPESGLGAVIGAARDRSGADL